MQGRPPPGPAQPALAHPAAHHGQPQQNRRHRPRRPRPHPFRARLHHMKFAEITSITIAVYYALHPGELCRADAAFCRAEKPADLVMGAEGSEVVVEVRVVLPDQTTSTGAGQADPDVRSLVHGPLAVDHPHVRSVTSAMPAAGRHPRRWATCGDPRQARFLRMPGIKPARPCHIDGLRPVTYV